MITAYSNTTEESKKAAASQIADIKALSLAQEGYELEYIERLKELTVKQYNGELSASAYKDEVHKLDIAFGSYYYVYSNDNETKYTNGACFSHVFEPASNKVYEGEDVYKFAFLTPSPHAKLYRTKIAKKIEFPHKISFTDYILYIVSLMNSKRVMHIEDGLAYYLIDREGNSMTDTKPKIGDFHYKVFTSIIKQYENQKNISFDSFYYRMFLHFIFINSEITKIPGKKDYKEKRNLSYELLTICSNNRKKIYPYLKYENSRRKLALRLLLNPLTRKLTFLFISNKNYKKNHQKRK